MLLYEMWRERNTVILTCETCMICGNVKDMWFVEMWNMWFVEMWNMWFVEMLNLFNVKANMYQLLIIMKWKLITAAAKLLKTNGGEEGCGYIIDCHYTADES